MKYYRATHTAQFDTSIRIVRGEPGDEVLDTLARFEESPEFATLTDAERGEWDDYCAQLMRHLVATMGHVA